MPGRTARRELILPEVLEILEQLRPARKVCIAMRTKTPIGSAQHVLAGDLIRCLDSLAEGLTGSSEYFLEPLAAADAMPKR